MTFVVDGTNGLTFPNSTTQASASKVLQVVNAIFTTITSTTSSSFVTTGFSASITPSSTSSKVFIILNATAYTPATQNAYYTIYRGGTNLGGATYGLLGIGTPGVYTPVPITFLDSPATTSSTTYTVYFKASGTNQFNDNGITASLTLQEIAA